jgi:hypothetical protein
MSAGIKANNDGSAAIQVGGTDYITIGSTGNVTIPQSQTISGNLVVTGTATIGGQPAGGNYALNAYVSPTTWTKPTGLKAVKITVVGAGGNGGGVTGGGTGGSSSAGGGGGGGAAIDYIPAPSIPGPVAVTAGAGTNSFGAFCSATAGSAGASGGAGGAGGVGSGGNLNINGTPGGASFPSLTTSGFGGPSILGGGAVAIRGGPGNVTGAVGGNYGGGSSGSTRIGPGPVTVPGPSGTTGIVIVEEFY